MTRTEASRRASAAASSTLTPREIACLDAYRRGRNYGEIATMLRISIWTVNAYLVSARKKLDARTTAHAADIARNLGLII